MGTTLCELGVLGLRRSDDWRPVAGRRATSVLSLLALDRRRVRTLDEFVEAVWRTEDRPRSARQSIQNVISQLRREHGAELIETVGPGYRLGDAVASEREQFLDLLTTANDAHSDERALEITAEAATLWRGEPWIGLDDVDALRIDQSRLLQAWQRLRSLRAESLSRADSLVEAQALWAELAEENPLDEDTWLGWARSLEADNRRVESLRVLDRARHALGECGILPGPSLREAEDRLLAAPQDHRDDRGSGGSTLPRAVGERPGVLIGRERALTDLEKAWGDIDRAGQVVIVEGSAGIGKSTLITELAHRVAASGANVLFGAADDVLQLPFQPFVLALDDHPEPLGEPGADAVDPTVGTDSTFQVIDRLRRTISSIAADAATLLLIEDIHWADAETVLAVRSLARRLPRGVMIVVTTRPLDGVGQTEHHAGLVDDATRVPSVRRFVLSGLSGDEAASLLEQVAPGLDAAQRIVDLLGGNPLLLVEYANSRRFDDVLEPEATLAAVHLRTLGTDERRSIELAATLGESFREDDLVAATDRDPGETRALLTKAADRGLVAQTGTETWRFRHALVRDAILVGLAPHIRARRHLEVGSALAAGSGPRPAEIARHFLASGNAGRESAVVWLERAAEAATRAGAHEQAARHWSDLVSVIDPGSLEPLRRAHFEQASALARAGQWERSRTPYERAVRLASELGDDHALADAIIGWARAPEDHSAARRFPDFVLHTEELAERVDPARAAKLIALRSIDAFDRNSLDEGHRLIDRAMRLADDADDGTTTAFVQRARFRTWWDPAQLDDRYRSAQHLATVGRTHDSPDTTLYAIRWQVIYGIEAGRLSTSMHLCRQLIALGNRRGEPFHVWFGWSRLAVAHLATGDVSSCHDAFRRADDLADVLGTHYVRRAHEGVRVGIEVQTGPIPDRSGHRPDEHVGPLEQLLTGELAERAAILETIGPQDLEDFAGLNGEMPATFIWIPVGVAAAATGSEAHASALIPLLSPLHDRSCVQIPATTFLGPISLVVAALRDLTGDDEGAVHDYEHAVRWSDEMGAATPTAVALHALAALRRRRSETTEADDLEARARRLVPDFDLSAVPLTRALTRQLAD